MYQVVAEDRMIKKPRTTTFCWVQATDLGQGIIRVWCSGTWFSCLNYLAMTLSWCQAWHCQLLSAFIKDLSCMLDFLTFAHDRYHCYPFTTTWFVTWYFLWSVDLVHAQFTAYLPGCLPPHLTPLTLGSPNFLGPNCLIHLYTPPETNQTLLYSCQKGRKTRCFLPLLVNIIKFSTKNNLGNLIFSE